MQVLGPGKVPPPSTVGCSCVYVLRRTDGFFYCGESDDIKGSRLSQKAPSAYQSTSHGEAADFISETCCGQQLHMEHLIVFYMEGC